MKNIKIQTPESKLVTVCALKDVVKAELIKNMLLDHGIKAEVSGEFQAGFTGALPIEVVVRESDAAAAVTFIEEHFPEG